MEILKYIKSSIKIQLLHMLREEIISYYERDVAGLLCYNLRDTKQGPSWEDN